MKVQEIYEYLKSLSKTETNYSDGIICGEPDKEVKKMAVSCMPTVDVIRDAITWGADLLLTHEPTFYSNNDTRMENDKTTDKKIELIENAGLSIIRFHDYMHGIEPDMIGVGVLKYIGIDGDFVKGKYFGINRFNSHESITPVELAKLIEERMGVKNVRICGARDIECTKFSVCFGAPMYVFEEARDEDVELVLVGEVCEWDVAEYIRDTAALGGKKAMLVMGHMGSERDGMRYLEEILKDELENVETKYFDCGEVYTYAK